jgi:mRNA guanylyltransferase
MPHVTNLSAPGLKIDGELLYTMRNEVAQLLDKKNTSFPGAQPVSFARRHIEELAQQDYYVCEKSDGMRYLLYLTEGDKGEEIHYLIDRKNDYWYIPDAHLTLHLPQENNIEGFHVGTLIDGELVLDKVPGEADLVPRFLVFDCLVLDGKSLMDRPLGTYSFLT